METSTFFTYFLEFVLGLIIFIVFLVIPYRINKTNKLLQELIKIQKNDNGTQSDTENIKK